MYQQVYSIILLKKEYATLKKVQSIYGPQILEAAYTLLCQSWIPQCPILIRRERYWLHNHFAFTVQAVNLSGFSDQSTFEHNTIFGLRISETFGLTWDDIDMENRTLTVNKAVQKRNYGVDVRKATKQKDGKKEKSAWYFSSTKTESSNRTIKFGTALYKALKHAHTSQIKNRLSYGEYYTEHFLKLEKMRKATPYTALFQWNVIRIPLNTVAGSFTMS